MKYGFTLDRDGIASHPAPLQSLAHQAREGERLGYSYAVIGDRLESGVDPFLILTAIAEASGTLELVTSVVILPPRGILVTAKQFAGLDVLTGGRVIAGVGTGSLYRDYNVVGLPAEEMGPRFEEGVQAMRAYVTPGAPPFKGRFYDTTGVSLEPKPARPGGLAIHIGSWGRPSSLRRVARLADGGLSSAGPGHQTPEQFATDVALLRSYLVEEGKDPATFPTAVSTMALYVSDDPAELAEHGGPGFVPRPAGVGVHQPEARPSDDPHGHDMVGTRAACIEKVRQWQATGIGALHLVPRGPDPIAQMRRFIDQVASRAS
jgi:alkanesulfonate monooxygenase SsuD/methylene tetrahydromethanopterin reductase-like flavin-dependent oxidoreductase (luciferase family)